MKATRWAIISGLVVIGIVAIGILLVVPAFAPFAPRRYARPPFPIQREKQREVVRERVHASGGWEVLRRECESLFTNGSRGLWWPPPGTQDMSPDPTHSPSNDSVIILRHGPLPPALASLEPQEIRAFAYDGQPPIVRIKLFGAHMTGTRGIPYYGLWIVCGPAPEGYTPQLDFSGVTVTGEVKKIADSVFEVH